MIRSLLLILFLNVFLARSSTIFEIEIDYEEATAGPSLLSDEEVTKLILDSFKEWQESTAKDEDSLPTPDMIESYGYVAESHQVQTKDGYINTLHRIPPKGYP